jgi:hypothetical protein
MCCFEVEFCGDLTDYYGLYITWLYKMDEVNIFRKFQVTKLYSL